MVREIGRVKAIYRYPVKSMAGQQLNSASLGWHGFNGDRRFAFIRLGSQSGFPWLTASKFPQLIQYIPVCRDKTGSADLPTHIQTPKGQELELRGEALQQEISKAYGSPVELIQLDQGIFDEASVSIISQATLTAIEQETGMSLNVARFRPNILIETLTGRSFEEDEWIGKIMWIGQGGAAAAVNIYLRDSRCMMINLDPATGAVAASVLKAVVRMNENNAGVYATVMRTGLVSVGDKLFVQEI
jgi:uncharacterized protein YcbX